MNVEIASVMRILLRTNIAEINLNIKIHDVLLADKEEMRWGTYMVQRDANEIELKMVIV